MTDKSQKEDMRAALQGDLERARERRGSTLLDREPGAEPLIEEPEPQVPDTPDETSAVTVQVSDEPEPEPEPEPQTEVSDTPDEAADVVVQVSDTLEPEPEPELVEEPEPEPEPKRRFLWFLRG